MYNFLFKPLLINVDFLIESVNIVCCISSTAIFIYISYTDYVETCYSMYIMYGPYWLYPHLWVIKLGGIYWSLQTSCVQAVCTHLYMLMKPFWGYQIKSLLLTGL